MIPEFFVLVSFFYHFGLVANLIIKRAFSNKCKITPKKSDIICLHIKLGYSGRIINYLPVQKSIARTLKPRNIVEIFYSRVLCFSNTFKHTEKAGLSPPYQRLLYPLKFFFFFEFSRVFAVC